MRAVLLFYADKEVLVVASKKTQNTNSNKTAPAHLSPWKPGQSGNPGGRPKMPPELKEKLREASAEAFDVMIEIARNKSAKPADRIRASEILVERYYGKSPQPICGDEEGSAIIVKLAGELEQWGK